MPRVVIAGEPSRRPLVTKGDSGSEGNGIFVSGNVDTADQLIRQLTGHANGAEINQHQMVVCAVRDRLQPPVPAAEPPNAEHFR